MSSKDDVTELLQKLQRLQLQQQDIINKIHEIYHNEEQQRQQHIDQPSLEEIPIKDAPAPTLSSPKRNIKKGDRVRIINKICNPLGKRLDSKDKTGTVTGVDLPANRVYIKTDNGTKTWRLLKNIEII
jgi:hypothetical protein